MAVRGVALPREGAEPRSCADALSLGAGRGRFAVADGATEAYGSRQWARVLARAWTLTDVLDGPGAVAALERLGADTERDWRRRPLPWYAEEKAGYGSFAAFCGLQLEAGPPGRWYAVAVGDCCLFQERAGALRCAFPLGDPAAFGNHPALVPTRPGRDPAWVDGIRTGAGDAVRGDVMWLMSDAIAQWYLRTWPDGRDRRRALHCALMTPGDEALRGLVGAERAARRLRDDDVAVARIEVR